MDFLHAVKKLKKPSLSEFSQSDFEDWGLINIKLRSHQLEGARWLAERYEREHGCILGDEMGLGKTLQSIGFLLYLNHIKKIDGPFLILCPLSVVSGWESEFKRAAPHFNILNYCSGKELRQEIQQEISDYIINKGGDWKNGPFPFHVLLAHYEVVLKDANFLQKIPWQCVIVDEGHRLKNPQSLFHQTLKQFTINHHLLLTGTPVQNNLEELYSLLSFVSSNVFPIGKIEKFVHYFSNINNDTKTADLLHSILEPFLLRRTKSEVLLDLPLKSEVILYTRLSNVQRKIYRAILTKDLSAFGDSGSKTRLMNILIQLRKCINHPYLFDGVEPEPFEIGDHLVNASGKLYLIDKLLEFLKANGHRVLIFSQMTRMLDIIQDYLGYRGYSYERLDGSVRGEERFLAVKNFMDDEETSVFLLSTKAGGQGLNLVGADTVIFVDSDFNPQNDLQAAARAHRIGQTRPVKVIRLIAKETAEEIILKRSEAKLSLTHTVIEGGKFSHMTQSHVTGDNSTQLADILKFGLEKIMSSDESSLECEDLESILGRTDENGRWVMNDMTKEMEVDDDKEGPETIYIYEGQDYSRSSDEDRKTFDELISAQLKMDDDGERILRSETRVPLVPIDIITRKRKPLTQQQLEERKKKREEARLKRQKLQEEKDRKREEEKERKRLEWWNKNKYTTLNISLESSSEEEEEEEEEGEVEEIRYVVGDVTQPQYTGSCDAVIVHCVDNSGRWGKGGVFSAISARSPQPGIHYTLAGKMKDLSLGDAHIIPVDDVMSRDEGRDMLALLVSQSRDSTGRLSGIKLSALDTGLLRVARLARRRKASVHLPRIGHSTPNFNWYGTERLIRKHLASRGIPTMIYYFPRHGNKQPDIDTMAMQSKVTSTSSTVESHIELAFCSSDRLIKGTDHPLPNLFTGIVIYFHSISSEETEYLSRYIIAYDGDIEKDLTSKVTHILCPKDMTTPLPDIEEGSPQVVMVTWVKDCLSEGILLSTNKYLPF